MTIRVHVSPVFMRVVVNGNKKIASEYSADLGLINFYDGELCNKHCIVKTSELFIN